MCMCGFPQEFIEPIKLSDLELDQCRNLLILFKKAEYKVCPKLWTFHRKTSPYKSRKYQIHTYHTEFGGDAKFTNLNQVENTQLHLTQVAFLSQLCGNQSKIPAHFYFHLWTNKIPCQSNTKSPTVEAWFREKEPRFLLSFPRISPGL